MKIAVPVSPGELIDKITILEIKRERMKDELKLHNVRTELALLRQVLERTVPCEAELDALWAALKAVNERLWKIEDEIRACERAGDFGRAFVALARAVYRTNDERSALKQRINARLGSALVEEKSYAAY